jgi:hypothetical protein
MPDAYPFGSAIKTAQHFEHSACHCQIVDGVDAIFSLACRVIFLLVRFSGAGTGLVHPADELRSAGEGNAGLAKKPW